MVCIHGALMCMKGVLAYVLSVFACTNGVHKWRACVHEGRVSVRFKCFLRAQMVCTNGARAQKKDALAYAFSVSRAQTLC